VISKPLDQATVGSPVSGCQADVGKQGKKNKQTSKQKQQQQQQINGATIIRNSRHCFPYISFGIFRRN